MKTKNKIVSLIIFLCIFLGGLCEGVFADDDDQWDTVTPISQIQAPDTSLPSGVTYQKGILWDILSKMFRQDNKKIATAFLHPFHILMQSANTWRVPAWDGTAGINSLVPGTIRDNPAQGIIWIWGMPTIGSGTLQIIGPGTKISSNEYCDENGANCFDPLILWGGALWGTGNPNYVAKFSDSDSLTGSSIYDNGLMVGIGTSTLSEKLTVNGNIAINALWTILIWAQYLYGDNATALYYTSNNTTQTQLIFRDSDLTVHGRIYGANNGADFGLVDGDNQWSYQAVKDEYTAFVINNSEKMRIFSGGTVSIGSSVVGQKLDVTGNIKASGDVYTARICNTDGSNCVATSSLTTGGTIWGAGSPNYITKFSGTGITISNSIIYDNGTNVGISNTGATQKLDVTWNIRASGNLMWSNLCNADGSVCVSLPLSTAAVDGIGQANYLARFTDNNSLSTGAIQDNATAVWIGVAPTTDKLTVAGDIRSTANGGSYRTWWVGNNTNTTLVLQWGAAAGVGGNIELWSNAVNYYDATTHSFRNLAASAEYGRFGSDANFAVGTATTSAARITSNGATTHALSLQTANASPWGLTLRNNTATQRGIDIYQDNSGNSYIYNSFGTANQWVLFFGTSGNVSVGSTTVWQKLDVTGNVRATGNFWGASYCNASWAGCATAAEVGHLSWVTSSIQTQLNGKQATITGAATSITGTNLATNSALVSDASGKVAASATVSSTELGHLDGVSSPIQSQFSTKAPLASPVFTGNPTAPTPATADNDTSLATTAFVKAQGYMTSISETDPQVGTISDNYVPRWLTSQLVNGIIRDDGAWVGIWTAATAAKLTLANNVASGPMDLLSEYQTLLYNTWVGTSSYGLGIRSYTLVLNTGGAYNFDESGTTRMTIASGGNVWIGITPNSNRLHVSWNVGATGWIGAWCEGACETSGGYSILYANGQIRGSADVRAPLFYDLNNTAFYLDPASTSITNDMRANIYYDQGNTGYYIDPASTSITNDMRANIYYDQGNTGYYLDPASTSNTNVLYRAQWYNGYEYDVNDNAYYVDPNGTTRMNYMWRNYGFNWTEYDWNNTAFYVDPNNVSIFNDLRSSIIYDRDNTGYYVDPASTTRVNQINMIGTQYIQNASPTMLFQDADHRSAALHTNSNIFYILSGNGTNGAGWDVNGSAWGYYMDLNTDTSYFGWNIHQVEGAWIKTTCVGNCF